MSADPALAAEAAKGPELSQDPRASRGGSLWKQRATISLRRASLWREEASRGKDEEAIVDKPPPVAATPAKRPLMEAEDEPDYFQQLEEAVKKRKLMGMRMSDLPPLLSPESLFTKSIPAGINQRVYCRAPSNRIGVYFSPETMEMSEMRASEKIMESRQLTSTSYEKPVFPTVKRPAWKNSDTRPAHYNRCYDPALDSPYFEYTLPSYPPVPSPPRRRKSKGLVGSPVFTPYLTEDEEEEESRISSLKRNTPALKPIGLINLGQLNPRVVESPRSMHTLAVSAPPIPPNMMKVAEDILRYQFYVESGVDERFIAPIRERWTKRAVDMVGKYVKRGLSERVIQATLRRVLEEVQHEYLLSMRKAIVDYVLQWNTNSPVKRFCTRDLRFKSTSCRTRRREYDWDLLRSSRFSKWSRPGLLGRRGLYRFCQQNGGRLS
ncbi:uncharacterized protein LOC112346607 [Selaginella moellendorffii]|uniref:uncharacterized protein LOC112346607 n=1 Tax=Selaginella moellendorffii TaxID=88036 RepID=UPI000D1C8D87|nr:uncharacterized protein LOC112346607 [Selaginella moellendorffii]|eukprot:XP_024531712.1 uncharacterized protein LOC112346607 [Selaginella moellendorffii]